MQRIGSEAELNNGLPADTEQKIGRIPGVGAAMGGLMDVVSFPDHDLPTVIINGWDPGSPLFKELDVEPGGKPLTAKDHNKVLLGRALANDLGVKVGDKIPIYSEQVTVAGIYSNSQVYERNAIAALLSDMQRFMNRPHQITGIIVRSNIPKDDPQREAKLRDIATQIEALGKGISAVPTTEFIDNLGPIKAAKGVAWATSAIALLIGAIGMLNTMVMSVYERVREIGTLRAIGWRKIRVMRMILVESLLLSLAGGIIGSVAAVGLTHLLSGMKQTRLIAGDIDPWIFVEGFVLALIVGLIGAIYPAYWGANLRPIEAMRKK